MFCKLVDRQFLWRINSSWHSLFAHIYKLFGCVYSPWKCPSELCNEIHTDIKYIYRQSADCRNSLPSFSSL